MKTFGMNYRKGMPGDKIVKTFGKDVINEKLAAFYKSMGNISPEIKKVADEFFKQYPSLK